MNQRPRQISRPIAPFPSTVGSSATNVFLADDVFMDVYIGDIVIRPFVNPFPSSFNCKNDSEFREKEGRVAIEAAAIALQEKGH